MAAQRQVYTSEEVLALLEQQEDVADNAYKKRSGRSRKVRDKKIKTWCPKCNVHLCLGSCFEQYHTMANYRH